MNLRVIKSFLSISPPRLHKILSIIASCTKSVENPCVPIDALIDVIVNFVSHPGKRFLWVHVMDTHYPYMFDNEVFYNLHGYKMSRLHYLRSYVEFLSWLNYGGELSKECVKIQVDAQEAAIATVDMCLYKLVKKLDNVLDKTLIIITSDHGEEYLEHGAYGHVGKRYLTHMYEELLRIPFIILDFTDSLPLDQVRKKLMHDTIMQVDILPTLCEIIGVKHGIVDGHSLFKLGTTPLQCRKLIAEASLLNASRGIHRLKLDEKIIVSIKKASKKVIIYDKYFAAIYDLANDPYEKRPLLLHLQDLDSTSIDNDVRGLISDGLKRVQNAKRVILQDYVRCKVKQKFKM